MNEFAKIFESEKYGQILVKHDQSEEVNYGAEICFYFSPPNFGVCCLKIKYKDTEEDWLKSKKAFEVLNLKDSEMVINKTYEKYELQNFKF